MVLFFEWHQIAAEPKNSHSCVPMTGEDTGLEPLALPLAGYLGKVHERAESLEYCPWCTSKGFTYALHSYHINLQESITLCTNPQCLFPLVTRPLEDVLSSLVPVVPTVGTKRKNTLELEEKDTSETPLKRLRSSKVASLELQQQLEHGSVNLPTNDLHPTPKAQSENGDGNHKKCLDTETESWDTLQDEDVAPSAGSAPYEHSPDILLNGNGVELVHSLPLDVNGTSENGFKEEGLPVLNGSSRQGPSEDFSTSIEFLMTPCDEQTTSTEEKSAIAAFTGRGDADGIRSEDLSSFSPRLLKELVSVPKQLLWKNSDNLCWLDSLLAALVNCKTLRRCKPKDEPRHSTVWQLIKGYEDICAGVQVHQQTGRDGVVKVPSHVLQKANDDLQSLRMSVFNLLQPKLHCTLGQRETPVFAMPLLLTMDSWVEHLFQSTFHWEFKCSKCEVVTKERVKKTLPTFTNIVPDWHPLQATHFSPCNVCGKKNQMRTMLLESVPPVFALHFVEGLPDCDVTTFTFNIQGKRYSVTTVIQYSHRLKHFVTWIWNDGAWLEYDDLNHTDFKTHQKLQIPAHEMHVVFWEVEEDADPPAGSPLNTFSEQPAPEKERTPSLHIRADESLDRPRDQSLPTLHNHTDIVGALTEDMMDTTAPADTSIGSTTLLDAFEGLSHNDIITLTLVEVDPADSGAQLLNDKQPTQDASAPTSAKGPEPSPDSSLPAAGGDVCHLADVEPPESVDGSSTDATSTPAAKRGRRRGTSKKKSVSKQQRGKEAAAAEEAPHTSPPAPSELPVALGQETTGSAAQDDTLSSEVAQQASTDTSPLSTSQKSPPVDYNARWSFLLSKRPVSKSASNPAPPQRTSSGVEVKSFQPIHSTPNLTKIQTIPSELPKPQLVTTDITGLPPKAAEMYGGFGTKSSTNPTPLPPSPPQFNGNAKLSQSIPANHLAPPMAMPANKHSHSFKVPLGLSETEALRYKLIKKLKAKKKKLAKLNQLLGSQDRLQPDSTALISPSTVASSTYDSSGGNDFLSDLLSPATTASNFSPDSTGFLDMLVGGQEAADNTRVVSAAGAASQTHYSTTVQESENFLDDFLINCGFEAN